MVESTISLSYLELKQRVGRFLGYDRDSTKWTDEQLDDIEESILSGLRQFYYPPVDYQWRFLSPNRTLVTAASDASYDLPDDFGSLSGTHLTFQSDYQTLFVEVTGESRIRKHRQSGEGNGRPMLAAIVPIELTAANSATAGQRFKVELWPTPDAVYTLEYRCEVIPFSLTDARIYPYGGAVHAETILESCLSAAERHINNEKGVHWQTFMSELLPASIQKDKQLSPRIYGYMDDSRNKINSGGLHSQSDYYVTVNGVMPE